MKTEKISSSEATLTLTADEMRILNNAMNEALEALASDQDEFETRMGVSVQTVQVLLKAVNMLVRQMN